MATPQTIIRRRVLVMAGPVIGENLLQTLLGIVDTILVAGLGSAALAGVGTAQSAVYMLIGATMVITVGAAVLIAQAVGAQQWPTVQRIARQTLVWSILLSIPISILGVIFTPAIVALFGMAPDATQVAIEYLHVTIATMVVLTIMLLAGSILRGAGDSRTPLFVTIFANIINVFLTYGLIYGAFGLPALGAVGSAWGTFAARLVSAILLVCLLWRGTAGVRLAGRGSWWPELGLARSVIRIGLPAAFEETTIVVGFAALTPIIAILGTDVIAAHRIVVSALSLAFLPGIGFAIATTTLVGQSVGAGDMLGARTATAEALRWALIWMGAIAVGFICFAPQIMQLFQANPEVSAAGIASIQISGLIQVAWGGTFVYGGALRGTGDTRTPLIISGTMMWVVVGLAYLGMRVMPSLTTVWVMFLIVGPIEVWLLRRAWLKRGERMP